MRIRSSRYCLSWLLLLMLSGLAMVFCSQQQTREELRIMTFNIRYGTADDGENSWPYRQSHLIDVIKRYHPDILGVQEALEFQIVAIAAAFPNWRVFGLGRYHGVDLPDRPHENRSGESCKIFYDTTKFQLMDHGTFWHSETPEIPGSMTWSNSLPRITTWGMFETSKTQKRFLVMNTHYHWGEPYVTNTSNLIMKRWLEIGREFPAILMGDFNLAPGSWTHRLFCGEADSVSFDQHFFDPWVRLGKSERGAGTYHGFKGDRSGNRIDWILLTADFRIKNIQIIHDNFQGKYPSDHFPVLAMVQLK